MKFVLLTDLSNLLIQKGVYIHEYSVYRNYIPDYSEMRGGATYPIWHSVVVFLIFFTIFGGGATLIAFLHKKGKEIKEAERNPNKNQPQ